MAVEISSHLIVPAVAIFGVVLLISTFIYKCQHGPLSHLPGPAITKYTGLWLRFQVMTGQRAFYIQSLHQIYGPVVRISPDEASAADLESTKAIHKISNGYLKTSFYEKLTTSDLPTLFNAIDPQVHSRFRKLLAPAMSESSMKQTQDLVQSKVDLVISQMKNEYQRQSYVDVFKWFHFMATDVIGDLSFGDSFRMLERGEDNEYMNDLRSLLRLHSIRLSILDRPFAETPNLPVWPFRGLHDLQKRLHAYAGQSLNRYKHHMAMNPNEPRPMFFSRIMGQKGRDAGLSDREVLLQAQGFIVAGTDTTAVTATYLIWAVCSRPDIRSKLNAAIASLPKTPNNEDLKSCDYLEHIIDETLRLYGAAPGSLPRRVPAGGRTLAGHFVPEKQTVSTIAYVLHRDPYIFAQPEGFDPDRWQNPTKEMRDAFMPFGGGSRVCIGLHLARMELRMATVAFFKAFPNAQVAYGANGFNEKDMDLQDYFIIKPAGSRCLIK